MKIQPARLIPKSPLGIFVSVFLFASLVAAVLTVTNREFVLNFSRAVMEGAEFGSRDYVETSDARERAIKESVDRERTTSSQTTTTSPTNQTTTTSSQTTTTTPTNQTTSTSTTTSPAAGEPTDAENQAVIDYYNIQQQPKTEEPTVEKPTGALESCGGGISTAACFCTTTTCYWNDSNSTTWSIPRDYKYQLTTVIEKLSPTENYARLSVDLDKNNIPDAPLTRDAVTTIYSYLTTDNYQAQVNDTLELEEYVNLIKSGVLTNSEASELISKRYIEQNTASTLAGPKSNAALREITTQDIYPTAIDRYTAYRAANPELSAFMIHYESMLAEEAKLQAARTSKLIQSILPNQHNERLTSQISPTLNWWEVPSYAPVEDNLFYVARSKDPYNLAQDPMVAASTQYLYDQLIQDCVSGGGSRDACMGFADSRLYAGAQTSNPAIAKYMLKDPNMSISEAQQLYLEGQADFVNMVAQAAVVAIAAHGLISAAMPIIETVQAASPLLAIKVFAPVVLASPLLLTPAGQNFIATGYTAFSSNLFGEKTQEIRKFYTDIALAKTFSYGLSNTLVQVANTGRLGQTLVKSVDLVDNLDDTYAFASCISSKGGDAESCHETLINLTIGPRDMFEVPVSVANIATKPLFGTEISLTPPGTVNVNDYIIDVNTQTTTPKTKRVFDLFYLTTTPNNPTTELKNNLTLAQDINNSNITPQNIPATEPTTKTSRSAIAFVSDILKTFTNNVRNTTTSIQESTTPKESVSNLTLTQVAKDAGIANGVKVDQESIRALGPSDRQNTVNLEGQKTYQAVLNDDQGNTKPIYVTTFGTNKKAAQNAVQTAIILSENNLGPKIIGTAEINGLTGVITLEDNFTLPKDTPENPFQDFQTASTDTREWFDSRYQKIFDNITAAAKTLDRLGLYLSNPKDAYAIYYSTGNIIILKPEALTKMPRGITSNQPLLREAEVLRLMKDNALSYNDAFAAVNSQQAKPSARLRFQNIIQGIANINIRGRLQLVFSNFASRIAPLLSNKTQAEIGMASIDESELAMLASLSEDQVLTRLKEGKSVILYHQLRNSEDFESIIQEGFKDDFFKVEVNQEAYYAMYFSTVPPTQITDRDTFIILEDIKITDISNTFPDKNYADLITEGYGGAIENNYAAFANSNYETILFVKEGAKLNLTKIENQSGAKSYDATKNLTEVLQTSLNSSKTTKKTTLSSIQTRVKNLQGRLGKVTSTITKTVGKSILFIGLTAVAYTIYINTLPFLNPIKPIPQITPTVAVQNVIQQFTPTATFPIITQVPTQVPVITETETPGNLTGPLANIPEQLLPPRNQTITSEYMQNGVVIHPKSARLDEIALVVFSEASNGTDPDWAQELLSWSIINRAYTTEVEAFYTGGLGTLIYSVFGHEEDFRSNAETLPGYMKRLTNMWLNTDDEGRPVNNRGYTIREGENDAPIVCESQCVRYKNTFRIVQETYYKYQNGVHDPTKGSIYFSKQSTLKNKYRNFNSYQELYDHLEKVDSAGIENSYVSEPFDQMWWNSNKDTVQSNGYSSILYFGTEQCVSTASCKGVVSKHLPNGIPTQRSVQEQPKTTNESIPFTQPQIPLTTPTVVSQNSTMQQHTDSAVALFVGSPFINFIPTQIDILEVPVGSIGGDEDFYGLNLGVVEQNDGTRNVKIQLTQKYIQGGHLNPTELHKSLREKKIYSWSLDDVSKAYKVDPAVAAITHEIIHSASKWKSADGVWVYSEPFVAFQQVFYVGNEHEDAVTKYANSYRESSERQFEDFSDTITLYKAAPDVLKALDVNKYVFADLIFHDIDPKSVTKSLVQQKTAELIELENTISSIIDPLSGPLIPSAATILSPIPIMKNIQILLGSLGSYSTKTPPIQKTTLFNSDEISIPNLIQNIEHRFLLREVRISLKKATDQEKSSYDFYKNLALELHQGLLDNNINPSSALFGDTWNLIVTLRVTAEPVGIKSGITAYQIFQDFAGPSSGMMPVNLDISLHEQWFTNSITSSNMSKATDFLTGLESIEKSLLGETRTSTEMQTYLNQAKKVIEITNKVSQYSGQNSLSEKSPLKLIVEKAAEIVEEEFTKGITTTDGKTLDQLRGQLYQKTVFDVFTSNNLLYDSSGKRVSIQNYLNDRYQELIQHGMTITADYKMAGDVVSYLELKQNWTDERKWLQPAAYQEFLEGIGLNETLIYNFDRLGILVPVIKITTAEGREYEIPVIHGPKEGEHGAFRRLEDNSGFVISGSIRIDGTTLINYETGKTDIFNTLGIYLHELDHAIYYASRSSYISQAEEKAFMLESQANDLFTQAVDSESLNHKLMEEYKTLQDTDISKLTIGKYYQHQNDLKSIKHEIVMEVFGKKSEKTKLYEQYIMEYENASDQLYLLRLGFDSISSIVAEGLARNSEIAYIQTQINAIEPNLITKQELSSLGNFLLYSAIVLRDAANPDLADYSVGLSLITFPNDDLFHVSASIYIDDLISKYVFENPDTIFSAAQHLIPRTMEITQIINPELTREEFNDRFKSLFKQTLSNTKINRATTLKDFLQAKRLYENFIIFPVSKQIEMLELLKKDVESKLSDREIQNIKQKNLSPQDYYYILQYYNHVIIPQRRSTERVLDREYDIAYIYGGLAEYVRNNSQPQPKSALLGSGPAQWFENWSQRYIYDKYPQAAIDGTSPRMVVEGIKEWVFELLSNRKYKQGLPATSYVDWEKTESMWNNFLREQSESGKLSADNYSENIDYDPKELRIIANHLTSQATLSSLVVDVDFSQLEEYGITINPNTGKIAFPMEGVEIISYALEAWDIAISSTDTQFNKIIASLEKKIQEIQAEKKSLTAKDIALVVNDYNSKVYSQNNPWDNNSRIPKSILFISQNILKNPLVPIGHYFGQKAGTVGNVCYHNSILLSALLAKHNIESDIVSFKAVGPDGNPFYHAVVRFEKPDGGLGMIDPSFLYIEPGSHQNKPLYVINEANYFKLLKEFGFKDFQLIYYEKIFRPSN